jgi:hypothetical protein
MLSGACPYSANTAQEWIALHAQATPLPPLPDSTPPPLARAVKRMLAEQPELRQQTMREVIQDLRTAARGDPAIAALAAAGAQLGPPALTDPMQGPASDLPAQSPAPPAHAPPQSENDVRAARRRLGEIALGVAVVVIYFVYYWQDTALFLKGFFKSLRFGL